MNGFVRTFIFAMALLGMLLAGGLLALLLLLSANEDWRDGARNALLSPRERQLLQDAAARAAEPPRLAPPSSIDMERLTSELADQLGRGQIRQLVEELRAKQAAVDDLRANMQREDAEIRLARADLMRVQRQIEEDKRRIEEERREIRADHERFARAQVENLQAIRALNEHEQRRYRELAQVYEAMRNDAWLQLRQMEADEIARILTFMQQRRAASVLALAARDLDHPGMSLAIHQALLRLDPEGETGSQIQRLATLYGFMSAEAVLNQLQQSTAAEVAAILIAMQGESPRLVADILTTLRRRDDPRELEVQRLMNRADTGNGAGNGGRRL
ncbi:MAG: hypothetical protein EA402_08060 [Planctomycetota bacterium]|nr:MAG: hypothetical protein EA402_08060 [Planctomycetota bacterium]